MNYQRRSFRAITSVPPYPDCYNPPSEIAANFVGTDAAMDAAQTSVDSGTTAANATDNKLRKPKIPKAIRKKMRNKHLSKIVAPKSALMLLNELKPGVIFDMTCPTGMAPMFAQAIHDGKILGQGSGKSKNAAKNAAADAAFKKIIKEKMDEIKKSDVENAGQVPPPKADDDPMETSDPALEMSEQLPWASLASFAIHRLFSQWHGEGIKLPLQNKKPTKAGTAGRPAGASKQDLPPNAAEMHPVSLINQMFPGIKDTELHRSLEQNSTTVTVGYLINETMYSGTASNRKAARKEAARRACNALYGFDFN